MWGPNFVITNVIVWYIRMRKLKNLTFPTFRMFVVTGLIFAWAYRLRNHILERKSNMADGEDYRYKEMRERWEK